MKPARLALALLLHAAGLGAESEYFPAAQVFAPGLGLAQGPRALGAGGAHTAVSDDVFALAWNPAGLDLVREPQLALMHNEFNGELGLRQEVLAYAQSFSFGGLGMSLNYFSLGDLEQRDAQGVLTGHTSGSDVSASLGYGAGFLRPGLRLGLALEGALAGAGGSSAAGLGLSLGALSKGPVLDFGASLMHLGSGPGGSALPGAARAGLAYHPRQSGIVASVDGAFPFLGVPSLHAGIHWAATESLDLRAGWRQDLDPALGAPLTSPSLGLGGQAGPVRLDYAYLPAAGQAAAHQLAAVVHFGADFFGTKLVVRAENATATAKALYAQGLRYLERGQKLEALVAFKQCLQLNPGHAQAQEQVLKVSRELKSGEGKDPALQAMINAKMKAGDRYFSQGLYARAMQEWEFVLDLDKDSKEAYSRILLARHKLLELTQARLDAALAQLEALKGRIFEEVRILHRLGIADYVEGQYQRALDRWQEGLDLDPSDPRNLRRDMERARARLKVASLPDEPLTAP